MSHGWIRVRIGAVALVLAMAIPILVANRASAASPVTNVKCFLSDDGAGFTDVFLAAGNTLDQPGPPVNLTGCGSASAAPPTGTLNGACGSDPCSATASASADANIAWTLTDTGAVFTSTSNGSAGASVGASQSGPGASGEQSIGGIATFTLTAAAGYQISGSASIAGQNVQTSAAEVRLDEQSPHPQNVFLGTRGGNSASGTLEPGTYTFRTFIDARASAHFNSVDPSAASSHSTVSATGSLTIGTPPGKCPPDATPSVQVGEALAEGCFTQRTDTQGHPTGVFETDQEAWIGGFDLRPDSGAKLVVEPGNSGSPIRADGGGVEWVLSPSLSVPAPLGELKPFTPSYTLGVNTAGSLERVLALPLIKDTSAQVTVSWPPGGASSTIAAQVSIEKLSENLGTAFSEAVGHTVGTLAGSLTVTLSNNAPLKLSGASLQVPEFTVEIHDTNPPLRFGFGGAKFTEADDANGKPVWSAEVTALFPWQDNQGAINAGLSFADSALSALKLGVSGFQVAIGKTGWDWTGANGTIGFLPKLAFDVGASFQEHAKVAGDPLFRLTGSVKGLQLASDCKNGTNPFEFLLSGNSPPLEKAKIGTLATQVRFCAYVPSAKDFAFEAGVSSTLNVDLGPAKKIVTATGSASGWFSGTDFNLDGSYDLTLPVIGHIGATGVLSSAGYAFCGTYHFITEGFATSNWLEAPQDLSSCDFTPFRVQPHAADLAAAGGHSVHIPDGQSAFGIAVRGSGGAPRVRVLGPHGEHFTTPAGTRAFASAAALILPVAALHTTYVYLHKPSAGSWRIVTLPGSAPVARVDTARRLPAPRVTTKVKIRHGTVSVSWNTAPIPGQRIALLDRAAGVATKIQGLTAKHKGTVTFSPASPLTGHRTIEADVFENGLPRAQLTVARYRLAVPQPPGRVTHPVATRGSTGLAISWRKAPRAHDYLVTITAGGRTVAAVDSTRTSVLLTNRPAGRLTVLIQPREASGRAGPLTTLSVA